MVIIQFPLCNTIIGYYNDNIVRTKDISSGYDCWCKNNKNNIINIINIESNNAINIYNNIISKDEFIEVIHIPYENVKEIIINYFIENTLNEMKQKISNKSNIELFGIFIFNMKKIIKDWDLIVWNKIYQDISKNNELEKKIDLKNIYRLNQ